MYDYVVLMTYVADVVGTVTMELWSMAMMWCLMAFSLSIVRRIWLFGTPACTDLLVHKMMCRKKCAVPCLSQLSPNLEERRKRSHFLLSERNGLFCTAGLGQDTELWGKWCEWLQGQCIEPHRHRQAGGH